MMRGLSKLVGLISCVCIVIALATGLWVTFRPIDVLREWTLHVDQPSIAAGSSVVINSMYTKVMDVTGTSNRYFECKNGQGYYTRYGANQASANRQPGAARSTGVLIVIPSNIPNLPTTCRVQIVIDYDIYTFRKFTEFGTSNEFQVTK